MSHHLCRFCGKFDKVLFSFELQMGEYKVSTFVCKDCMENLKQDSVTLNVCLYCGNIFLTNEICDNEVSLVSQCGICERKNQIVKGGDGCQKRRKNEYLL